MSTIVVVKKDGFVAIAADSLSKQGGRKTPANYIVNHQKIFQVGESYVAISGPSSAKTIVQHYFARLEGNVDFDSVSNILQTWLDLHDSLKETYHLNSVEDENAAFESSQMDVIIANKFGIFGVTAYRHVEQYARFSAFGMGDEYAMGAMYAIYDNNLHSAEEIARTGVKAACEFHDGSGEPIYSYSIKLCEMAE